MYIVYLISCLPLKIHTNGKYSNCNTIKALKRIRLFLNERNLATLVKALIVLLVFKQIFDTCLSNLRLLSNVIPRSLTLLPSQTIPLSTFAHNCSLLFPDIME